MKISLTNVGKRFNREWIFRGISAHFETGSSYAITGANGSGKSTLLQIIAGIMLPSTGTCVLSANQNIDTDLHYQYVAYAAPYQELVEEMTGNEFLQFHQVFKPLLSGISKATLLKNIGLESAANKQIRYYSSGMKQRLKLAQCILSDVPFVLLDEPCTNLDEEGISMYHQLISTYTKDRCVIVCSNDPAEYHFCKDQFHMGNYKS